MRKLPFHRARHLNAEHINQLAQTYGLGTFLRMHQCPPLWRLLLAELRSFFKEIFPRPFFTSWPSDALSFPLALSTGPLSLIKWLSIFSRWLLLHLLKLFWRIFLLLMLLLVPLGALFFLFLTCLELYGVILFIQVGNPLWALISGALGCWWASIIFAKVKGPVATLWEIIYERHILRQRYYECTDGFLVTHDREEVTTVVRWSDLKHVFSMEVFRRKRSGYPYPSPKMFTVEAGDRTKLVIRAYKLGRTAQRRYNRLYQEQARERKRAQRKLARDIPPEQA